MGDLVTRRDIDMSAIQAHLEESYIPEDAEAICYNLASAMLDGIDILMSKEEWCEEHTYRAIDCWTAQIRHHGLAKDETLLEMVDDVFLYLSIEAGIRDMEGIDPSQFL